ncbi:MAG: hypothetical protein M1831_002215 [Alyxoria varia]|nr:MAG: hypothetical protein M1831_002215 [Alyxoria varia]
MDSPSSRENLSTSTPSRQKQRAPSPPDTTANHTHDALTQEHVDSPVRKKPRLGDSNSEGLTMSDQSAVSDQPVSTSPQTSLPPPDHSTSPAKTTPSKVTLNFRKSRSAAAAASPAQPSSSEPPAQSEMQQGAENGFINVEGSPTSKEDIVDDADISSSDSSNTPVHEIKLDHDGGEEEGGEEEEEEEEEEEDEDDQDTNGSFFLPGSEGPSAEADVFDRFPFSTQGSPEEGAKRLCLPFDTENSVTFKFEHISLLAEWLDEWVGTVNSSRRSQHRIYAACGDFWDSIGELFGKLITRKVVLRGITGEDRSRPRLLRELFTSYLQVAAHMIAMDCDDVTRNPAILASGSLRSTQHLSTLGCLFLEWTFNGNPSPKAFFEKQCIDPHRFIPRLAKDYVDVLDLSAGHLTKLVTILSEHVHAYPATADVLIYGMRTLSGIIQPRIEHHEFVDMTFNDSTTVAEKSVEAIRVMQNVLIRSIEKQTSTLSVEVHRWVISYMGTLARGAATMSHHAAVELVESSSGSQQVEFAAQNPDLVRILVVEGLLLKCLYKGRMELRVLGITLLAEELVVFYNARQGRGPTDDPWMPYMAEVIAQDQIIEYIVSANSHPQLISKSQDIVGFLFVTKHWPKRISDAVWHTVSSGQDSRIIEAVVNLLTTCFRMRYVKPDTFLPACEEVAELPLRAFSSPALFSLIDQMIFNIGEPDLMPARITLRSLLVRLLRSVHSSPTTKEVNVEFVRHSAMRQLKQLQEATEDDEERRSGLVELVRDLDGDSSAGTPIVDFLRAYVTNRRILDDRSFVLEELGLPSIVARNLGSFSESAGSQSALQTILTGLQARLHLLMEMFDLSAETHLDLDLERLVWDNLVGNNVLDKSCQDMGWHLLADFIGRVARPHGFVERCVQDHLAGLALESLSEGFIGFSKNAFSYTRRFHGKITDEEGFSDRLSDLFWKTILKCPHDNIVQHVTQMLCALHLDLNPNRTEFAESLSESHVKVVERCIDQLRASATKLQQSHADGIAANATASPHNTTASGQSLVSEEACFSRGLNFLLVFLSEVRIRPVFRVLEQNKTPSPQLANMSGTSGDSIVLKYQSFQGNGNQSKIHEFEIGSLANYGDLYTQLCRLTGFSDLSVYVGGQKLDFIQNSSSTVANLVGKGHLLVKSLSENTARRPNSSRALSRAEEAILAHLDEIYNFLDLESALSRKVFEFLGEFPPQQNILGLLASENFSLKDMFPFGKFYKTLHHLRSLRSILQDQLKGMRVDRVFVEHGVRAMTQAIADPNVGVFSSKDGGSWSLIVDLLQCLSIFLRQLPLGSSGSIADSNILTRRLVELLQASKEDSNADLDAVAKYSYENLTEAGLHDGQIWFDLKHHTAFKELHSWLLLSHQNPRVRDHVRSCIENFAKRLLDLGSSLAEHVISFYWDITTNNLMPQTIHNPFQAKDVLLLTSYLFQVNVNVFRDRDALRSCLSTWSDLLLSYRHEERRGHEEPCELILGLARIINQCLACRRELGENESSVDLVEKILRKFLFPRISAESQASGSSSAITMPVLHTETRKELFIVLMSLCNDAHCLGMLGRGTATLTEAKLDDTDLPVNCDQMRLLRSPAGYVGLRNLTNTCYMNSLLTQLFMNRKFRDFILSADLSYDRDAQKLLTTTQDLFASMQFSQAKFADTEEFAGSIVPYDSPQIDITVQMDVDEFYNLLSDRWEDQLPTREAKDKFRSIYGGQIVTQIKSRDCEHVSETSEPYLAISCEVKGKGNLIDSLRAYVEGDAMEGDNKYKCESCNGKFVDAVKRSCLKDVPDNLVIHLKRFDFDLISLQRSKINEYFEFPGELDMSPYKADFVNNPERDVEKDLFELTGVLVHNGTAEAGHYYSYIRLSDIDEGTKQRWVEFNDADVGEFDASKIPETCFGGPWDVNQPSDWPKQFNAYMLFYQRKSAIEQEEPRQPSLTTPDASSLVQTSVSEDVAERTQMENETRIRWYCLLDSSYAFFIERVLFKLGEVHEDIPETHELAVDALRPALRFIGQVGSRAKDAPFLESILTTLLRTAQRCPSCCSLVLQGVQTDEIITNTLVQHPIQRVRYLIMRTITELLGILRPKLPSSYGLEDVEEGSISLIRSDKRGALPALAQRLHLELPQLGRWARYWDEYFLLWASMIQLGLPEALLALDLGLLADCFELLLMSEPEALRQFDPRNFQHDNVKALSRGRKNVSYHALIKLASELLKRVDIYGRTVHDGGFRSNLLNETTLKVPVTPLERHLMSLNDGNSNYLLTKVIDGWDMAYDQTWNPGEIVGTLLTNNPSQADVDMMANTIAQSIHEYYPNSVEVVLQTALGFCKSCPTVENAEPIINAAVASAFSLESVGFPRANQFGIYVDHPNQGGGSHIRFFADLALLGEDETPYLEHVIRQVPFFSPTLLMFDHQNVRTEAREFLKMFIFAHFPEYSEKDEHPRKIDQLRTNTVRQLFHKCTRTWHLGVKQAGIPASFGDPTYFVLSQCAQWVNKLASLVTVAPAYQELSKAGEDTSIVKRMLNVDQLRSEHKDPDIEEIGSDTENASDLDEAESAISDA